MPEMASVKRHTPKRLQNGLNGPTYDLLDTVDAPFERTYLTAVVLQRHSTHG